MYYGSGGAGVVSGFSNSYDQWYYTPLNTALDELNLTLLTWLYAIERGDRPRIRSVG